MSDLLAVVFGQDDRVYAAGDSVDGRVLVRLEDGEACRGVYLTRFWRTHGKGNTDHGPAKHLQLHDGPLVSDRFYEFPFNFPAPRRPLTYHGRFINIDHYVEAAIDTAWAADPSVAEEYLLVPGPANSLPEGTTHGPVALAPKGAAGIVPFLGGVAAFFGLVTTTPILLILGAVVAIVGAWRPLAKSRLGEVTVNLDSRVLVPGKPLSLTLHLRPRKRVLIRGASAVLRARERATSGKGSDRKKHTHQIHRRTTMITGPTTLAPGEATELRASIPVPAKGAYTFRAHSNSVTWDLVLEVDIPAWPDWRVSQELVCAPEPLGRVLPRLGEKAVPDAHSAASTQEIERGVPIEVEDHRESDLRPRPDYGELGAALQEVLNTAEQPGSHLEPSRRRETTGHRERAAHREPVKGREPAEDRGPPEHRLRTHAPDSPGETDTLSTVLIRIRKSGRRTPERAALIDQLVGRRFSFELKVDRVERSFGSLTPAYRGGRTILGSVTGTRVKVSVRFPTDRSDEIARARRGTTLSVEGSVVEWQDLQDRPTIEVDHGGSE